MSQQEKKTVAEDQVVTRKVNRTCHKNGSVNQGSAAKTALCAQMAIFLAVSYFGQTVVVWQLLMAVAGSMRQWTSNPIPAQSSAVNGGSNPMNPTPRRFRSTRA
jgi:hypothetical protein